MELSDVSVNKIVENHWNPNHMEPIKFDALVESIRSHPELLQADRLIVRNKGKKVEILGGAHRFRAVKKIGIDTVPIGNLGDIDDAEAKLISLMLNNHGEDDFDKKLEVVYSIRKQIDVGDIAKKIGEDSINLTTLIDNMVSGVDEIADMFDKTDDPLNKPILDVDTFDIPEFVLPGESSEKPIANQNSIPTMIQLPTKAYIGKAIQKGIDNGKDTIYSIINDACRLYVGE
ncbi:MAG: ParB/RepB/Spo0J family partition protein [Methanosarcinaceae archaeon]